MHGVSAAARCVGQQLEGKVGRRHRLDHELGDLDVTLGIGVDIVLSFGSTFEVEQNLRTQDEPTLLKTSVDFACLIEPSFVRDTRDDNLSVRDHWCSGSE